MNFTVTEEKIDWSWRVLLWTVGSFAVFVAACLALCFVGLAFLMYDWRAGETLTPLVVGLLRGGT